MKVISKSLSQFLLKHDHTLKVEYQKDIRMRYLGNRKRRLCLKVSNRNVKSEI